MATDCYRPGAWQLFQSYNLNMFKKKMATDCYRPRAWQLFQIDILQQATTTSFK